MTKNLLSNIVILALGGVLAWSLFFRDVEVREVKVPVSLTSHQLDSMGLSIETKLKGSLKPVILPGKTIIDSSLKAKQDSVIRRQINEIISLKDSLKGKAKLSLEYHGFVGDSLDTLNVEADFVSDTISVVFRPKQRNFEVVHKEVVGRNIIQRIRFGPGVGAAIQGGKVVVIPSVGLFYDIFEN